MLQDNKTLGIYKASQNLTSKSNLKLIISVDSIKITVVLNIRVVTIVITN